MALDPNIGRIKFLRSKTAGLTPTTADIDEGELALNLVDRTIYTRNGNNIIDMGFGKGGQVNGNITASGTVKATKLEGPLTGNADSATKLQNTRTLSWTGDATGSLSFNGSANVSDALTLANSGVTAGTYKSVTVDAKGRVTAGSDVITGLVTSTVASGTTNTATSNTNTYLNIVETVGSAATTVGTSTQVTGAGTVTVTSDTAGKLTITGSQNITGNAATATALQTARSINGVLFNGTSDINIQHVAVRIPGNSNLNNYQTPGIYYCDADAEATSTVNTPVNLSYSLVVTSAAGIVQTFTAYNGGNNDVYVRGFYSSSWSPWKKLAFTNDSITGNAGSATKLQTTRSIGITGSGASGSISFDGTGNVNIPLAVATQATATNNTTIATTAFVQAVNIADTGSSATSLKLKTARTIGGVSFDGSANIDLPGVNKAGNQSTTGNAATATSAAKWTTARTLTIGDSGKSVDGSGNVSWSRLDMGVPWTTTTTSVGIDNAESCIGYISNSLLGQMDGALYSHVYSDICKHQIQGDYRTGQIALRGKSNGTWQAWRTVLDSGNYNNYSPTKTGTGASGSWGISITGNATTASSLATARTINGVSFDGSANITIADNLALTKASNLSDLGNKPTARTNLDVYSKTESNFLALPLGTPIWHNGTRLTIDDGYASYDGQLLNRADFPSLWAKVQSKFVLIGDAEWLANPTKRAAYSSGDGVTTFRMPDLNGFLDNSIKGLFLRGAGNGSIAGEVVGQSTILTDAIRNITGSVGLGGVYNSLNPSGALGKTIATNDTGASHSSVIAGQHQKVTFDASLVVPTAGENRPVSAVGIWICRVSAGTAEQVSPNTAPSLTGGNTWAGSQNVQGNLEVTGTFNADIKPLLNASGSLPIYALRSWGIVEGTATPARLVKGGNIASVVDEGVGQYKITFATPMPDLNYGVLFGSTTYTLNDAGTYGTMKIGTKTVNGFTISCGQQGYVDVPEVSFGVIY